MYNICLPFIVNFYTLRNISYVVCKYGTLDLIFRDIAFTSPPLLPHMDTFQPHPISHRPVHIPLQGKPIVKNSEKIIPISGRQEI